MFSRERRMDENENETQDIFIMYWFINCRYCVLVNPSSWIVENIIYIYSDTVIPFLRERSLRLRSASPLRGSRQLCIRRIRLVSRSSRLSSTIRRLSTSPFSPSDIPGRAIRRLRTSSFRSLTLVCIAESTSLLICGCDVYSPALIVFVCCIITYCRLRLISYPHVHPYTNRMYTLGIGKVILCL
jgi:hypothetical protein